VKKYLMTGLVVLLPIMLTIWILVSVINWLTEPFLDASNSLFVAAGIHASSFFQSKHAQLVVSKILILVFLFIFIVIVGVIGRYVFVRSLIRFGDSIVRRIPVISSVYHTAQELLKTVLSPEKKAFKQVVLVPFPSSESWTIGLLTNEVATSSERVPVFIPTTPNPTSGYLIMFRRSDIVPLTMSVEDAFRYVVSCGVLLPEEGIKIISNLP
jgi:uncharacterized membrane protein